MQCNPKRKATSCYTAYGTFERSIIRLGKFSQCDWYEYLIFRSLKALDQDLGKLHSISVSARDFLCDLGNITPFFWAHKQNTDDISLLCHIYASCKFIPQLLQHLAPGCLRLCGRRTQILTLAKSFASVRVYNNGRFHGHA